MTPIIIQSKKKGEIRMGVKKLALYLCHIDAVLLGSCKRYVNLPEHMIVFRELMNPDNLITFGEDRNDVPYPKNFSRLSDN